MPVDPDEILIFKLRGMKTPKKAPAPVRAAIPAQAPRPVPTVARAAPVPSPPPAPKVVIPPKQAPAPKPAPQKVSVPEAKPEVKVKQPGFFARKPKVEKEEAKAEETRPFEEERKAREVEVLEAMASGQYTPAEEMVTQKPKPEAINIFSILTGILFMANSGLFAYFIYPQANFVIDYIIKTGFLTFFLSWNYDYDISFVNLVLIVLGAISGLLMIARVRQSHFISGIVGASVILAVTFEYLNSYATYLLIVSVFSFVCIGALAYSRMSAVTNAEREEVPESIVWPRIETF